MNKNLLVVLSVALWSLSSSFALAIAPPIPGKDHAEVSKQKESMAREKKRMQEVFAQHRVQTEQAMISISQNQVLKSNADLKRKFEQMRTSVRESKDQRTRLIEQKFNEVTLGIARTGPLSDMAIANLRMQLKGIQDQQAASEQQRVAEFQQVVQKEVQLFAALQQLRSNILKMQHDMISNIMRNFR